MADENFYLKKAIDLPEYSGDIDDVDFIAVKTSDGYMKRVKTSTTIATKADKDADATAGDVAVFDENGNPVDGGVALDDLAKTDGSYASMAVGVADNLAGRGSVEAMYTFRTSGGTEDIGTGTATIEKMKGNTIVWNQLIENGNFSTTAQWRVNGGTIAVADNVLTLTRTSETLSLYQAKSFSSSHTYLWIFEIKSPVTTTIRCGFDWNTVASVTADTWKSISRRTVGANNFFMMYDTSATFTEGDIIQFKNCRVFDLTLMFGAGNEPTTLAEFEALYPLDYYDYNEGELVSNKAAAIKTIGFNQWDEEWQRGLWNTTGVLETNTTDISSKNLIPVIPSTNYYYKANRGYFRILYYNAEKRLISVINGTPKNAVYETPSNCRYINFTLIGGGSTYNNDICINLSWSGYRDGEYEPYSETTTYINGSSGSLATLTGKLNGEGESVTIYPDGMRGAGSAYDYLHTVVNGKFTKATKVMGGEVDLGDLNWEKDTSSGHNVFKASPQFAGVKNNGVAITSNGYKNGSGTNMGSTDNTIWLETNYFNRGIAIRDDAYTDAATFKAAMSGVKLIYELATPLEYTLDTPVPTQYPVNDFGTEQRLPADTADEVTAPIEYSVKYAMNAVDTIRRLPINYISKESFENFCSELASKLGTALNATITITPTYDSTDAEYDYLITITPNGE